MMSNFSVTVLAVVIVLCLVPFIWSVCSGIVMAFRRQPETAVLLLIFFLPGLVIWGIIEACMHTPSSRSSSAQEKHDADSE